VRVAPEDLDDGTARRIDESRALCSSCVSQERGAPKVTSDAGLNITYMDDSGPDANQNVSNPPNAQNVTGESRKSQRLTRGVSVPMLKPASSEVSRRSTQQIPTRSSGRSHATHPTQEAPAGGSNKWIAFVGGAALVLIGAAVALMNSPSETETAAAVKNSAETKTAEKTPVPTPVTNPTPSPTTNVTPVVAPPPADLPKDKREREALLLLEEAKVYRRTNMDDVYGYADKLEQIFNAFRATPAGDEAQKLLKAVQFPDGQSQLAPDAAWSGALNLLDLIDTKKDTVSGKWSKSSSGLTVEPEKTTRLQIPYEAPEEYDFKIVFKRLSGEEDVNQIVSSRGKGLMWSMAAAKNTWLGFECIQGKATTGGPASVKQTKALENNRSYTSIVQVRKRVVRAFLDGKLIKEYRTDYDEFSMRGEWKLKNERVPGVGVHNSKVVFEKIELRTVSGTGKKTR